MSGDGFTLSYVLLDSRAQCGGTYTSDTGVLRSPGYPLPYPHNRSVVQHVDCHIVECKGSVINPCLCRECEWIIQVEAGKQIRLNVTAFDVETHSNCNYDFLEIR